MAQPSNRKIDEARARAAEIAVIGEHQRLEMLADMAAQAANERNAILEEAARICEERAAKHHARGTRAALDQQAEADACAFAIRKAMGKGRAPAKAAAR